MKLELRVICKNYKHKRKINNKLIVDETTSEYYLIPITRKYQLESDDEKFRLTFNNQLLWLKYSNNKKEILLKESNFNDYIIINSKDIVDIEVYLETPSYFRKNVWNSKTTPTVKKTLVNDYLLALPIFEGLIKIRKPKDKDYRIFMISNEILLKQVKPADTTGFVQITNNFLLNKEALFIHLSEEDVITLI